MLIVAGDMTWGMTVVNFLQGMVLRQKIARVAFPRIISGGLNNTIFDMSCNLVKFSPHPVYLIRWDIYQLDDQTAVLIFRFVVAARLLALDNNTSPEKPFPHSKSHVRHKLQYKLILLCMYDTLVMVIHA